MPWLDVVGWSGSALLIYSLMQARVLRFRLLNLGACLVLGVFNAALEIWPMVAMNVALVLINLWHIRALLGHRDEDQGFTVVEVGPSDEYLRHVLRLHSADILAHQPDLVWDGHEAGSHAFLVQRGDETVGTVLLHDDSGVARVRLDYVTPRFRDFSPGKFVWRHSAVLRDKGFRQVVTPAAMVGAYYDKLGFRYDPSGSWVLDL